jgi:hypothetical protein
VRINLPKSMGNTLLLVRDFVYFLQFAGAALEPGWMWWAPDSEPPRSRKSPDADAGAKLN